jgi:hypothetical protein
VQHQLIPQARSRLAEEFHVKKLERAVLGFKFSNLNTKVNWDASIKLAQLLD